MRLPETVRAVVAESFGTHRIAEVSMMLPGQDQLPLHPPYERVLLAIVGLAEGRLERLAEFSAAAMADWRDVLYWWETPELAASASEGVDEVVQALEESDE